MNKQELIERIEDFPCEASLVTEMIRINKNTLLGWVKELDLPQPIKLKDVIARIKIFDVGTQKVWLNEILDELGSDYGTLKYKAGYEQGKLEGEWVGQQLKDADKIRQELNKPVVPQFVADWIEKNRGSLFGLNYDSVSSEIYDWVYEEEEEEGNLKKLHLACAIGYTVEKEKRYKVVMPNVSSSGGVLTRIKHDDSWFWIDTLGTIIEGRTHTRKELEEAGFGWVFDCPGIEIEEVGG
nr:MAG TPA: Protein of unknown function (DUF1642) [Caudoviricetes sp.]